MLSRMTWMTSIARGSLFWNGTVTNVLKKEKLPEVYRRIREQLNRRCQHHIPQGSSWM